MTIFGTRDMSQVSVLDAASRREAARQAAQLRALMLNGWRLV